MEPSNTPELNKALFKSVVIHDHKSQHTALSDAKNLAYRLKDLNEVGVENHSPVAI